MTGRRDNRESLVYPLIYSYQIARNALKPIYLKNLDRWIDRQRDRWTDTGELEFGNGEYFGDNSIYSDFGR